MRDRVEAERQALMTIQSRWGTRLGGPSFSPVECLDGSNPILDTIQELQDSPLCAVSTWGHGIEQPADVLRELQELYERALEPWEDLRTVRPPDLAYCDATGEFVDDSPEIYNRWPDGTFPRDVQLQARRRFRELVTTSRFSVDDHPDKRALLALNPIAPPLRFAHVAGLAATVCIVEALEKYREVLDGWAGVVREAIEDLRLQTLEIRSKTDRAGSWVAFAEADDDHQSEIETAATRAATKAEAATVLAAKKVESERQQRKASNYRAKSATLDGWVQHLATHPPGHGGMEATMQEFADLTGVSLSTVQRRHRDAKKKNLVS